MTKIIAPPKHLGSRAGMTLVEMLVTVMIAAIAFSGMVTAYTDGIESWNRATGKIVMYNEGYSCLSMIERFVRSSYYVSTGTDIGQPSTTLRIQADVFNGRAWSSREAEFYFMSEEGCLRWNNLLGTVGYFNQPLVPLADTHSDNPEDKPYIKVLNVAFTPMDPVRPVSPTDMGYALLKIELTMNDAMGDTLIMISTVSKRNRDSQS